MRVGIDGRALRASRERRGVAVYLEMLLAELARLFPDDEFRVLVPGGARPGALPDAQNVEAARGPRPGALVHASAALAGRPRLDLMLGRPDVVWAPTVAPLAVSGDTPLVLTVLDLSFAHRPRDFSAYERLWHVLARPARRARGAARVLTISASVRGEVVREWGLEPERVVTVAPGPGRARAAPEAPPPAGGAYVLAVGALEPRKLPAVLAEGHRRARERGLRAGLVFAGDGPLRAQLERAGASVLGRVSEPQLDALYAGALCVACVSREEGFGFTPLEGLAAGVPPVVSELGVFEETLGDAALRVPAGDAAAVAAALLRMEREPELRERIVAIGRERLALHSWERAALATRAVLAEAAR